MIDAKYHLMRSNQFQPTHIWNPWSNKADANLEDSACTVRVLLFFPISYLMLWSFFNQKGT